VRQPNETRARTALDELLRARLPGDRLGRLSAEGALLGVEDACELALSAVDDAVKSESVS